MSNIELIQKLNTNVMELTGRKIDTIHLPCDMFDSLVSEVNEKLKDYVKINVTSINYGQINIQPSKNLDVIKITLEQGLN